MLRFTRLLGLLAGPLIASAAPQPPLPVSLQPFAPACAAPCDAPARLHQIAAAAFEAELALNPVLGSQLLGEARFEGRLSTPLDAATRAQHQQLRQDVLAALRPLQAARAGLSASDRISLDLLTHEATTALAQSRHPEHLMPLNQYGGLPVQLAEWASGQSLQLFQTPAQYAGFLQRLQHLPRWLTLAEGSMREGMRRGIVVPRALVDAGLPALHELATAPLDRHPYAQPLRQWPATVDGPERQRLQDAYAQLITAQLQPALRAFIRFVEQDYRPKARQSAGLGALPGGRAWYQDRVAFYTTSALSPTAIHRIGLREVARVRAELEALRRAVGYRGPLSAFLVDRHWHPSQKPFASEQQILARYQAINAQIEAALPALFHARPKAAFEIRPEPEISRTTASDHYQAPAADGSRPGVFYAVIQAPADYEHAWMTSLLLHEGQPGHHFHAATQQELDVPAFRKHYWSDAYGEGWALYAETLGHEMGLYRDDPVALQGLLRMRLLRAVRLVVDTGLHHLGWSRARTMAYIRATEGATPADAQQATERYMADPGQALAYLVGALHIETLRREAERRLGPRFRLADFHHQVLRLGCVPLGILTREIHDWLARSAVPGTETDS